MQERKVSRVHRWIEGNVTQDDAALAFVIAVLSSITITVGTLFAICSWWLS